MRRPGAFLPLALAAACAHSQPAGSGAAAEVVELDARWAAAASAGDAAAFRALVAADAVFAGKALLRGPDEVWRAWKIFFAQGGPRIGWQPTASGAAGTGDLAWTTGRYRIEVRDSAGRPAAIEGEYVTVWERQADGWRVALDCGLEPPGALGPLERTPARSLRSRDGALEAAMGTWVEAGPAGRRGAFLTVREKAGDGWRTRFDSAVPFPPRL